MEINSSVYSPGIFQEEYFGRFFEVSNKKHLNPAIKLPQIKKYGNYNKKTDNYTAPNFLQNQHVRRLESRLS